MIKPRLHHYDFAHVVIPSIFFQDPAKFFLLLHHKGGRFLREVWKRAARNVKPEDVIDSQGLACELREIEEGRLGALISLPPPEKTTEAYFVAPVFQPPMEGKEAQARYFTLEYNSEIDTKTVLGEWTASRCHLSKRIGPEPNIEDFWSAICTPVCWSAACFTVAWRSGKPFPKFDFRF